MGLFGIPGEVVLGVAVAVGLVTVGIGCFHPDYGFRFLNQRLPQKAVLGKVD